MAREINISIATGTGPVKVALFNSLGQVYHFAATPGWVTFAGSVPADCVGSAPEDAGTGVCFGDLPAGVDPTQVYGFKAWLPAMTAWTDDAYLIGEGMVVPPLLPVAAPAGMSTLTLAQLMTPAYVAALKSAQSIIPNFSPAAYYRAGVGITLTAGRVSTWADQSGNGNDLVQATTNSQPYVDSDGSLVFPAGLSTFLANAGLATNSATISIVACYSCADASANTILSYNDGTIRSLSTANGHASAAFGGGGPIHYPYPNTLPQVITFTSNGNKMAGYANGQRSLCWGGATGTATGFRIGLMTDGTYPLAGKIHELAVFTTPLTEYAEAEISLDLQRRWGVVNAAPILYCIGDSITGQSSVTDSGENWNYHLQRILKTSATGYQVANYGISGYSAIQFHTNFAGGIGFVLNGMGVRNTDVFHIWAGSNDLAMQSASGAAAWAAILALIGDIRAINANAYIIIGTMLPRGDVNGNLQYETQRTDLNALIRSVGPTISRCVVADFAAHPLFAASPWPCWMLSTSDYVHPIAGAQGLIARIAADAFARVTGIPLELDSRDIATATNQGTLAAAIAAIQFLGTGAYSKQFTVTDGTNPLQNARVRCTQGAVNDFGYTDANGHITFSMDAATYLTAVTKDGYQYTPTNQVVTAGSTHTLAMTITSVPISSDPSQITIFGKTVDANGAVQKDVVVYARASGVSGTGVLYTDAVFTAISDASGDFSMFAPAGTGMTFTLWRGQYGATKAQTLAGVASGTLQVANGLGSP